MPAPTFKPGDIVTTHFAPRTFHLVLEYTERIGNDVMVRLYNIKKKKISELPLWEGYLRRIN